VLAARCRLGFTMGDSVLSFEDVMELSSAPRSVDQRSYEGIEAEIACEYFSSARYDFYWNDDFTVVTPVRLRWWDDASYIAYQCGNIDHDA
jgi:hypothetical protein